MARPTFVDTAATAVKCRYGDLATGDTFKARLNDTIAFLMQKTNRVKKQWIQYVRLQTGVLDYLHEDIEVYRCDVAYTDAVKVPDNTYRPVGVILADEVARLRYEVQRLRNEVTQQAATTRDTRKTSTITVTPAEDVPLIRLGRTAETRRIERIFREKFPATDAYRVNSAWIRVRVIDKRFHGLSSAKRNDLIAPLCAKLPETTQTDLIWFAGMSKDEQLGTDYHASMNAYFDWDYAAIVDAAAKRKKTKGT